MRGGSGSDGDRKQLRATPPVPLRLSVPASMAPSSVHRGDEVSE